MADEGADLVDIGAESSRPGSLPVREEEELERILPVLKAVRPKLDIPISIDTYKPNVARVCLENGADIINDITGFSSLEMVELASSYNAAVVVMHMQGNPSNMQKNPRYHNVIEEIKRFFKKKCRLLRNSGISSILIDPGIGFGKRLKHNLEIFRSLPELKKLGYPLMIGPSRKSFIGMITGAAVSERLPGTIASCILTFLNGADVLRVHDVKEIKQSIEVTKAINI